MQKASTRKKSCEVGQKARADANERFVRSLTLGSGTKLGLKSGWSKLYSESERQGRGCFCRPVCWAGSSSHKPPPFLRV